MWTETAISDGVVHFRVLGDVDASQAGEFAQTIATIASSGIVVVDLSDTTFADHTVLLAVAHTGKEMPGRVALILPSDPQHPVRRILTHAVPEILLGLAQGEDISSAISALAKRADFPREHLRQRMLNAFSRSWSIRSVTTNLISEQRLLILEARSIRARRR